jgi:hypothetical protein
MLSTSSSQNPATLQLRYLRTLVEPGVNQKAGSAFAAAMGPHAEPLRCVR